MVLDVGWVPGVSAVQALGRAGIPVYAVDRRPDALGFRSRYARPRVAPSRQDGEEAFVDFLARLGDELGGGVPIFPLDDDDLSCVARHRETLGARFRYPFPAWPTLARVQSKRYQHGRARELGIPVPRAAEGPTDALGFPVVVKPDETGEFRRRFGIKAFVCRDRAQLDDAWSRAAPFRPLVYELVPGPDRDLYTLGAYLSADGRVLGRFCGRKLRQEPAGLGNARAAEAVWVEEIVEPGLELLRGLDLCGPAQVEFKRDQRDGAYKLIEVNPRLWQWHGLAAACGVNFAVIAYRDLVGLPVAATPPEATRRRWSITLKGRTRPVVLRPPYVDPLLARDDPRLALAHLSHVAGSWFSHLRRHDRSAL